MNRIHKSVLVLIILINVSLSFKLSEYFGSKKKYVHDDSDLISSNHEIDQCKIIHVNLVARYS